MADSLPNSVFATYQPEKAFSAGPASEWDTLASGDFFTGRWAMWLATVGDGKQLRYKRTANIFEGISLSDEGTVYTGFSTSELNTSSSTRFDLISFTFTTNGEPVVAIQDRGDNTVGPKDPYEIIVSFSGNQKTVWSGSNPNLFNSVQVNYPPSIPSPVYPNYESGALVCYYYKEDSTGLYGRYISDGFNQEYIIASGLQPGFSTSTRSEAFPATLNPEYSPYLNSVITLDDDGNRVRVLNQKSNISFAADDFNVNQTGIQYLFESGYGNWFRNTLISNTSGTSFYFDKYFSDNWILYDSGQRYAYNKGTTLDRILYIGRKTGISFLLDKYFSDDWLLYASGSGITSFTGNYTVNEIGLYAVSTGFSIGGY